MTQKDTKTRILDAAEKAILKHGAEKTSLRMITAEAGVNSAAINYHFGSKENLVSEVFSRLIRPLAQAQLRMLSEAQNRSGNGGPALETIIRCYVAPIAEFANAHPQHRQICAKFHSPEDAMARFKSHVFEISKPVVENFFEALSRALPGPDRQNLLMRLAFMRTAASALLQNDWQIEDIRINLGLTASSEELTEALIAFIAAGLTRPA